MYSALFLEAGYEAKTPLREAGRAKCCFFSDFAVTWAAPRAEPTAFFKPGCLGK